MVDHPEIHVFRTPDGVVTLRDSNPTIETAKAVRVIGGVLETPEYVTIVSSDGLWVRIVQSEFRPVMGVAAWPMSWYRMDTVARSLLPGARLVNQVRTGGFPARWSRTYRATG